MKYSFDNDLIVIRITAPDAELLQIANDISSVLDACASPEAEALTRIAFESLYFDVKYAVFLRGKSDAADGDTSPPSFTLPLMTAGLYSHIFHSLQLNEPLNRLRHLIQVLDSAIQNTLSNQTIEKLDSIYAQLDQTEISFQFIKYISDKIKSKHTRESILHKISEISALHDDAFHPIQSITSDSINIIFLHINRIFSYNAFRASVKQLATELESDTPCYDEIVEEADSLGAFDIGQ